MNVDDAVIADIAIHKIGNKKALQELVLGQSLFEPDSDELAILQGFFLDHFKSVEFYNFKLANSEVAHSQVWQLVTEIFNDEQTFHAHTCQMARLLYALTESDLLDSGILFACLVRDIMIGDELTDAIGIYLCSDSDIFVTPRHLQTQPQLDFTHGTFVGKHEMACLIYHTDIEEGFKIDIIDKSKKNKEGQLWKDHFLKLKPAHDNFFQTNHVMGLTKSFVDNHLPLEFEVEKPQQLEFLDRSMDYFKSNDHFSQKEFADQIFGDMNISEAFGDYKQNYLQQNDIAMDTDFSLDQNAVKRQARHFKSVIKLDRNFHIYIHGDRSRIERLTDEQGRKYYKLYFDQET